MRRATAVAVLGLTLLVAGRVAAQDARQRQAAAEAYDRGTAAYLEGAYEEAGQWFETAHRMAPAAPALMQAIRAHEHNDNHARAATLALELTRSYPDDKSAADFASGVLGKHGSSLLRVEVSCDEDCKLDLDGKLQEYLSFFVTPGSAHQLTATFETGSKNASIQGAAGETRNIEFQAPPPPPTPPLSASADVTGASSSDGSRAPLPPLYTWIGVGLTAALGIATLVSGLDARGGVPDYKKAAQDAGDCMRVAGMDCTAKQANARSLLEDGQDRELRTNVLIGATAFAAVGTGVIALFLTDWSDGKDGAKTSLSLEPRAGGFNAVLKGRF
jgi:tetratricopeptide (TPR) repeat protein